MNRRVVEKWMRAGVMAIDPAKTWIDVEVALSNDVSIKPGTPLHGLTNVGTDVVNGPYTFLANIRADAGRAWCAVMPPIHRSEMVPL